MNVHVFLLMFFLIFSLALLCSLWWPHQGPAQSRAATKVRTAVHRLRHRPAPRTIALPVASPAPAHRLWGLHLRLFDLGVRSKAAAEHATRVNTEGFACPNRTCLYFGLTDASIHALVGDGRHGRAERIQTFRGPACHITFSARRDTPLYRLKTPSYQVAMVLAALAEGLDASEAWRVAGLPTSDHHQPF